MKFLREDNLQFQTISEEEERALVAECPPYLQDMVTFAIDTDSGQERYFIAMGGC